jgi:beta-lactamase superfamily II metal-dependent hydrolase
MHRVNKNSPAPAVFKAAIAALIVSLSVFHFSTPLSAQTTALDQLTQAAGNVEIPYALPPAGASMDAVAPGLNVYFVNVGQGDSEYIELPNGQNVLIDGGPLSGADSGLAKFLTQKNVKEINNVVLTHPHADHLNGLKYVFSNIKVDNFYDTQMDNSGSTADEALRAQAQKIGATTIHPAPGDMLSWGAGVSAKVLNSCPEPVSSSDGSAINNCSIVIKLAYQSSSILFVGDAQSEVEDTLLQNYAADLPSDVLKVGHHGSKYSSTQAFINAVHPKRAYIEVGQNNYGHPAPSTLNTLTAIGAKVFRTDLDGTQELSSDSVQLQAD